MNSEVQTWDMKHFYSWDEFKSMPNDIKVEYINRLQEKYEVGMRTISDVVFGLAPTSLRAYLESHNLIDRINTRKRGGRVLSKNEERLKRDVQATRFPPAPGTGPVAASAVSREEKTAAGMFDSVDQVMMHMRGIDMSLMAALAERFDESFKVDILIRKGSDDA